MYTFVVISFEWRFFASYYHSEISGTVNTFMKTGTGRRMKKEAMCSVGGFSSHFPRKTFCATLEVSATLKSGLMLLNNIHKEENGMKL